MSTYLYADDSVKRRSSMSIAAYAFTHRRSLERSMDLMTLIANSFVSFIFTYASIFRSQKRDYLFAFNS